ncbi:MAG: hypothetical protein ACE5F2_01615, partial [Candidatus Paceibacteria bacterium]
MNAKRDLILLILIVVGLGIAWLVTGGPERARDEGVFIDQPRPIGTGETYGKFSFRFLPFISGDRPSTIEGEADKVQDGLDGVSDELEEAQVNSKYTDKIVIEKRTSGPKKNSVEEEYIIIS